jgi:hypothetical protein
MMVDDIRRACRNNPDKFARPECGTLPARKEEQDFSGNIGVFRNPHVLKAYLGLRVLLSGGARRTAPSSDTTDVGGPQMSSQLGPHRASFRETTIIAGCCAIILLVLLGVTLYLPWSDTAQRHFPSAAATWLVLMPMAFILALLGTFAALVAVGGCVALYRDLCEERGLPYVATRPRERNAGPMMLALRRFLKPDARLRPGELAEVRSVQEILATLDDRGCLDGLPFMPEMAAYCGHRYPVLRRVDKIWEYAHGSGMRRMRNAVLLRTLRCDGQSHGGCQAACQLIWKEAWLKPAATQSRRAPRTVRAVDPAAHTQITVDGGQRYACQMTQIRDASTQLHPRDVSHYWRDLTGGNIRLAPLVTEISIRLFNSTQWRLRRPMWPVFEPLAGDASPHQDLGLQPGQIVRVKSKHAIEATLNRRFRNRGLEFGRDMLFYCGGSYRIVARINRLVHEGSGELLELNTPSLLLEGVTAIGGSIVNPQNEYYFWREIWLEPQSPARSGKAPGTGNEAG